MMTKDELKSCLLKALANNTLLTDKHDPNKMNVVWDRNRSVISNQVEEDLFQFIDSGIDQVFEYQNSMGKYYEIILKSNYEYASSGVPALSNSPYQGFDRIIAVNGKKQKWHIYGEDSKVIADNFAKGKLKNRIELL